MDKCIFCLIANKIIPSKIKYEDGEIIAFPDIEPKAKVHILIMPKRHIESLNDLKGVETLLMGKIIFAAKKIAKAEMIDKSGYRLCINTGSNGGQIIDHLHLHLLGAEKLHSIT